MSDQLPLVIRTLSERLHFRYQGPHRLVHLDTFIVDLADWKLSLTDKTPCFWIHTAEQFGRPPIDLAEEIRDAVREATWQNETILVLVDGPADELRPLLSTSFTHSGAFTQFAVFDEKQQHAVWEANSPTRVVQDILLAQIPRSQLAPYEISRPVTGSRFFGREHYLNQILTHPQRNYLVIGIRRVGKTSLLREVERLLELKEPTKDKRHRRLYVDCSVLTTPEEFYREIVGKLSPRDLKRFERESQSLRFQGKMFEYLAGQHGGQIVYLLDEIDRLLEHLGNDLSMFDVLRKASQLDGTARFIMAGFRSARRAVNDVETPFHNFSDTIYLGPFDLLEVRKMVEIPMDQLRVRLEGRGAIVQRIFRETAGMPNLVQFYCKSLLEQLDRDEESTGTVMAESLQSVYENAELRDFVLQTFFSNSSPLERAVVFAMISHGKESAVTFSLKDINTELNRRNLSIPFNALDEVCNHLDIAGIWHRQGRQFQFRIPLFAKMLEENYSIEFLFETARREFLSTAPVRTEYAR
jgi:hypothetical protein